MNFKIGDYVLYDLRYSPEGWKILDLIETEAEIINGETNSFIDFLDKITFNSYDKAIVQTLKSFFRKKPKRIKNTSAVIQAVDSRFIDRFQASNCENPNPSITVSIEFLKPLTHYFSNTKYMLYCRKYGLYLSTKNELVSVIHASKNVEECIFEKNNAELALKNLPQSFHDDPITNELWRDRTDIKNWRIVPTVITFYNCFSNEQTINKA